MIEPRVSVIIPTHNRNDSLTETLHHLTRQGLPASDYEIIVVDDGSSPPVMVPEPVRLVRLEGEERSAARNAGARAARGELLLFLDDDLTVGKDFLASHLAAHGEWPEALLVGAVRLPEEWKAQPFGRFRQELEDQGIPSERGLASMPNFCTAQNMLIKKKRFDELGGFDTRIVSSEDQDLALRHRAVGGDIVFVPEAQVVHRDTAIDIRRYCHRAEWGSRMMIPFCRRHPDFSDNVHRRRVNGSFDLAKSLLSMRPIRSALFRFTDLVERTGPDSRLLDRLYRILLGTHIYIGYRDGDRQS